MSSSPTITNWQARPVPEAMSDDKLAGLIEREIERHDQMLFTLTPREELDEIGRAQALADQAFVQQARAIVAAHARACKADREFAADELALALGVGLRTAEKVLAEALGLAGLPGMLEAVQAGMLTTRHARAVLRELNGVPELSVEHRSSIGLIVIARMVNQTPGELAALTRRLILTIDLAAAQARQDEATRCKKVLSWPEPNGQGVLQGRGPIQQIAACRASMRQWLHDNPKTADDPRTEAEREFDLFVALLTGGAQPGQWQAQIVVPFSTVDGGELELDEIPGYGPVLPSTARDLAADAQWSQVAVDEDGVVIAVSDPIPAPTKPVQPATKATAKAASCDATERDKQWWTAMRRMVTAPPKERLLPEQLGSAAYTTPSRLKRYLQARDRTCVFPGCHRQITDIDHRIPWPLGPTEAWNLQLLCRHHHRAKQALFTVELTEDGHYLWTTRGGWQFLRHRQGY